MFLSADDVTEILKLIDGSHIDELRLQTDRFDFLLRRTADGSWTQEKQELGSPKLKEVSASKIDDKDPANRMPAKEEDTAEHLVAIPTPLPGTFYRAPKPGEAPFVEIGDTVEKNTVVAIIETMKLMNSITANTEGTVVEICVENAGSVDQDAVLMRVDPDK